MTVSPFALWMNSALGGFDQAITSWIHSLYNIGGSFFTPFMEFISFLGKDGIVLIILSLLLIAYKPTRRYGTAMAFGLLFGVLIVNCFLKIVIARPRPYTFEDSIFYQYWLLVGQHMESDKSFPSGHTTAAFDSMVPLWLTLKDRKKKFGWCVMIFAVLMGVSRVYLCVHYPTDVIGGIIAGSCAGIMGYIVMKHIPDGYYQLSLQDFSKPTGKHFPHD